MSNKQNSTGLKKGHRANSYKKNLVGPKKKLINMLIRKTVIAIIPNGH